MQHCPRASRFRCVFANGICLTATRPLEWRKEAKEDFDFVASRQFSEDELKTLAKPAGRRWCSPDRADHRFHHGIRDRQSPRGSLYSARIGDVKAKELLTGAGEWFRDEGFGDYADSAMFASAVICGHGLD